MSILDWFKRKKVTQGGAICARCVYVALDSDTLLISSFYKCGYNRDRKQHHITGILDYSAFQKCYKLNKNGNCTAYKGI